MIFVWCLLFIFQRLYLFMNFVNIAFYYYLMLEIQYSNSSAIDSLWYLYTVHFTAIIIYYSIATPKPQTCCSIGLTCMDPNGSIGWRTMNKSKQMRNWEMEKERKPNLFDYYYFILLFLPLKLAYWPTTIYLLNYDRCDFEHWNTSISLSNQTFTKWIVLYRVWTTLVVVNTVVIVKE